MLKLNCGVSRKTSDNNYGSLGASAHFEVADEPRPLAVVESPLFVSW
ncbi:MAG: hypothetical protein ABGZ53_01440 [Fuerstiella sp.]